MGKKILVQLYYNAHVIEVIELIQCFFFSLAVVQSVLLFCYLLPISIKKIVIFLDRYVSCVVSFLNESCNIYEIGQLCSSIDARLKAQTDKHTRHNPNLINKCVSE